MRQKDGKSMKKHLDRFGFPKKIRCSSHHLCGTSGHGSLRACRTHAECRLGRDTGRVGHGDHVEVNSIDKWWHGVPRCTPTLVANGKLKDQIGKRMKKKKTRRKQNRKEISKK